MVWGFPRLAGSERIPDDKKRQLLEAALERILRDLVVSPPLFYGWLLALAFFTSYPDDHPHFFWSFFAFYFLLVTLGVVVRSRLRSGSPWSYRVRVTCIATSFAASALALGLYTLATSHWYGDGWLAVQGYTLLGFAAVSTLLSYHQLLWTSVIHFVLLMLPLMAGVFVLRNLSAPFLAAAGFAFVALNLPALIRIHREYWTNVINATLLELQAADLEGARLQAEHSNALKSDFLATVSHELRTPLSGLLGVGALVLRSSLSADQRQHIRTMQRSASALLRQVDDLLDAARLESGRLPLAFAPFAPRTCIEDVIELFASFAASRNLALHRDIDPDLPPLLVGDAGRIQQVLANLLHNAIKFTTAGHVRLGVQSVHDEAGPWLEVRVADTGPGISSEMQAHLFERFHAGTRGLAVASSGSGLGLAISRELARAMGGDITFESAGGRGTVFTLRLPALPPAAAGALPDATSPRSRVLESYAYDPDVVPNALRHITPTSLPRIVPPAPGAEPALRVLVVDDDGVLRRVLRLMLRRLGCEVEECASGEAALHKVTQSRFDVMLLDCQMPGLDGFGTLLRLRELPGCADLSVVAMTANTSGEVQQRFRVGGVRHVLVKPLSEAVVQQALEDVRRPVGEGAPPRRCAPEAV